MRDRVARGAKRSYVWYVFLLIVLMFHMCFIDNVATQPCGRWPAVQALASPQRQG